MGRIEKVPEKEENLMEVYPSDLTDEEWAILEPLIPAGKPGGRPRQVDMRAVLNGIFYVLRAGCAWRMIPREYPPRSTVYGLMNDNINGPSPKK